MNVSAALYRAGSSVSRGGVAMRRIMSPPGASRRVELDVRIHHLRMLAPEAIAHTREEPLRLPGRDVITHGDAREDQELLRPHLDRPEVDDPVDPGLSRNRGAKRLDALFRRRLADDEPARAPGELVRDIDKDDADHSARESIEPVIAGQHGQSESQDRCEQARQRRAVLVEDGSERGVPQLLQEPAHRYALLARRVPCLSHRDAEREGLEDHREGQHDEADPDRAELLRVRESLVRLVHREDAAAEEQKERDDQRPEVALLAVTEWVPLRRGLHASADADVQKDMVAGV